MDKDYKNTPEGREVQKKYADILPLSRPEPIKPRMSTRNRGKLFSPFAALRGFDEEILDQDRVLELVAKTELSEEDEKALSDRLPQIRKGMSVTLEYFRPDERYAPYGKYRTLAGTVSRIDPIYREIEIRTEEETAAKKSRPVCIPFDDLVRISGQGCDGKKRI